MNNNKKNILIDATGIVPTPTGLGKYCYFLINALVNDDRYSYHILHQRDLPHNHPLFSIKARSLNFIATNSPVIGLKREFNTYFNRWFINDFDIFHCLSSYLPGFGVRIPSIVTVHDLKYILYPEFLDNRFKSLYYKWIIHRSIRKSDHIIAVSNATKRDIIKMGIPSSKITVVYEAPTIMQCSSSESLPETIKGKKFFLYVGECRPHKNVTRIIQAYEAINEKLRAECPYFVFAGARFADYREKYRSDRLLFVGPVDEPLLVTLYKNALALVYPSLYEGFGLPILEAMQLGTPVITSNCSSMPEVVGDAALLINPYDVDQLATTLVTLFKDNKLKQKLATLGIQHVEKFTWEKAASRVTKLYEKILL